eukprot:CAMPEP_0183328750 /NCGR_PEP_ID=MMETSP0160_2-20130417/84441_1 /TAXON_ID=2839 ORGANISM="Odontella Sinensis, Strain Grunow 1884" /NCGR_SAMPLE_ID=MMETSP0160_2 /ASSEMBLY_ACC=CAM_ASM_000250 /LENGTH=261 /DNA_ID=CAMNT_0025496921 /DNA_START=166 /DNA_END=952 /DNA_ORIENTATION=+
MALLSSFLFASLLFLSSSSCNPNLPRAPPEVEPNRFEIGGRNVTAAADLMPSASPISADALPGSRSTGTPRVRHRTGTCARAVGGRMSRARITRSGDGKSPLTAAPPNRCSQGARRAVGPDNDAAPCQRRNLHRPGLVPPAAGGDEPQTFADFFPQTIYQDVLVGGSDNGRPHDPQRRRDAREGIGVGEVSGPIAAAALRRGWKGRSGGAEPSDGRFRYNGCYGMTVRGCRSVGDAAVRSGRRRRLRPRSLAAFATHRSPS